jgi:hypothetical protein
LTGSRSGRDYIPSELVDAEMLAAVTGLFFFSNYYDPYE